MRKVWQRCECRVKHTDKNGRPTACDELFSQRGSDYRDCFWCWLKNHPTPVKHLG